MTDTNHIEVLREMRESWHELGSKAYDKYVAACDAAIKWGESLSARASAGEGGHVGNEWADMAANGVQWLRNIRDGISTADEALAEMESNARRITALAAAPQPAQAGASGGGELIAEMVQSDTQYGGTEVRVCWLGAVPPVGTKLYATPASPATGDDPCIECGADPGEACYPNCCTQTPQPAAASEWVILPRKEWGRLSEAMDYLKRDCADIWWSNFHAARVACQLAAAPQPQERDLRGMVRTEITREDFGPAGEPGDTNYQRWLDQSRTTTPAHGDGEGDDDERVIAAFRDAGMVIQSGATYSVRGQIAQLLNGCRAITTRPTPEAQEARDAARFIVLRDALLGTNTAAMEYFKSNGAPTSVEQFNAYCDAALALPAQGEGNNA